MTNKNFINLHPHYVPDEIRVNPLFNNVQECFDAMMLSMVQRWYDRLTNDAHTAVKILKFNPTVVTDMMFFTDGSMDGKPQYFGSDYDDIGTEMKNFALSLSQNDEEYEKCQTRGYVRWYSRMAQGIRWYKKGIEDIEKTHALTLSILPHELKEKVIEQIVSTDPVCQMAARNYYETLEEGRKEMLHNALRKMRGE